MSERRHRAVRGEGAIKVLIGTALVVVGVIAGFKIVPLHIRGNEVLDVMNEQANFAGLKSQDKIQYEIYRRGQEAKTPLQLQDIKISARGSNIIIQAKYEDTVTVLGYRYVYKFDKTVEKPVF